MNKGLLFSLIIYCSFLLTGCVSGLGPFSGYGCDAPEGAKCQSIHKTYSSGIPESQQEKKTPPPPPSFYNELRKPERVQRIWISEHETPEGDYQEGTYLYMVLEPASWRTSVLPKSAIIPYKEEESKDKNKDSIKIESLDGTSESKGIPPSTKKTIEKFRNLKR